MYNYLYGRITEKGIDYIVVECGGVGYHVYVSRADDFNREEFTKVYTYLAVREDDMSLYGFKTKDEKNLFLKIINVSGIGPKTAITMLSVTTPQSFIQAIELGNTGYLKKLPGVGAKSASQIILDLKGKLVVDTVETVKVEVNKDLDDTREALKGLGFKASDIDSVLKVVGQEKMTSQQYLKKALQLLRK
jgi:Holliday junction DNA helicase RuvA